MRRLAVVPANIADLCDEVGLAQKHLSASRHSPERRLPGIR
jgi:hypothetical protein